MYCVTQINKGDSSNITVTVPQGNLTTRGNFSINFVYTYDSLPQLFSISVNCIHLAILHLCGLLTTFAVIVDQFEANQGIITLLGT